MHCLDVGRGVAVRRWKGVGYGSSYIKPLDILIGYAALETFAMTILLYIVSGLFLLMAFGLVSAFGASKNLGVLLGALVYGASGIFAITMTSWWPLLVGFVLAILLRFAGAAPTPS